MVRELPGPSLPAVSTDRIRVIAPSDAHREPTREAHIAAFGDHWGSTPPTAERWAIWWSSHTARRDLSTIAVGPEGEVLSYALASEDKPGVLHFALVGTRDRKSTRLNSSHVAISYAVFCLKKKNAVL